uniref:SecY-independent transporter protein n=1 Tax=Dictyotopsis propagulifera TaxID=670095 RepID=UPI002E77736C|nr:SecY-independent transporter protein [Dictyotopsis propagulifera]WBP69944.1 SecY-independent transporter protein [Dictyotopsis propagulifera]
MLLKIKTSFFYLQELNYRIIYVLVGACLIFLLSYYYKQTLLYLLLPTGISHFISTEITEIFKVYLYLCFTFTSLIAILLFLIQMYLFFKPGFYVFEANLIFCYLLTLIFCYFYLYCILYPTVIQITWEFFLNFTKNFNSTQLIFELQLQNYLSYVQNIGIIISFIGPIVIFSKILLINTNINIIIKYRKVFYVIIIIISTLLTPSDITCQLLLILLLVLFYESQLLFLIIDKKYNNKIN